LSRGKDPIENGPVSAGNSFTVFVLTFRYEHATGAPDRIDTARAGGENPGIEKVIATPSVESGIARIECHNVS
jgi:hypothetical protein